MRPRRPSPALVVAVAALVVALAGTGYAATALPPKSVGARQLRDGAVHAQSIQRNAVTALQLAPNSVASSEIRDGSVAARDLAKGVLPAPAATTMRQASGDPTPAGAIGTVSAACQPTEHAVGGGGGFAGPPTTNDRLAESIPVGADQPGGRWRVTLFNGGVDPRTPVAYVVCASGG